MLTANRNCLVDSAAVRGERVMTRVEERRLVHAPLASAARFLKAFVAANAAPGGEGARVVLHVGGFSEPAIVTLRPVHRDGDMEPRFGVHWEAEGGGAFPVFYGELIVEADEDYNAFVLAVDGTYEPPCSGRKGVRRDRRRASGRRDDAQPARNDPDLRRGALPRRRAAQAPRPMSTPFGALTVPLDASDQAAHAVDYAVALARGGKTVLHFCSVVDAASVAEPGAMGAMVDPAPLIDALEETAHQVTDAAVSKAVAAGVSADAAVLFGAAVPEITQSARATGSDGIVICTHARKGFLRFISGSVTEAILTRATVPIIVVHHDDDPAGSGPITVALDGSPGAEAALETAIALATAGGRSLALMHVVQSGDQWPDAAPILSTAADRVRKDEARLRTRDAAR